eukprot:scaffold179856_cov33-Prasinocladus_malaysianus.AAC.1
MQRVTVNGTLGRCLDGSLPAYYFAPGQQSRKWVVFFRGGDWCTRFDSVGTRDTDRNCLLRASAAASSGRQPYKSIESVGK